MKEWTDFETQCLYDLLHERDWLQTARRLMPDRKVEELCERMADLRATAQVWP